MEDKPKLNLQQHVPKRVSKIYLIKIIFYAILLTAIIIFIFNYNPDTKKENSNQQKIEEVHEIDNVTIEP